jgi:hypothetical protein
MSDKEKKLLAKLMERDLTLALIARELKCEPDDGDDLVEAVKLLIGEQAVMRQELQRLADGAHTLNNKGTT